MVQACGVGDLVPGSREIVSPTSSVAASPSSSSSPSPATALCDKTNPEHSPSSVSTSFEDVVAAAVAHLQKFGYAVVPDVLDQAECADLVDGLWAHTELVTRGRVQRKVLKSWKNICSLYPMHGMLMQHWGYGQCQAVWDVRQNPKVVDVFARIWGTHDLTVSFDGCSFGLAPEVTKVGWQDKAWLHLDQALARNGLECVQGWVTGEDVSEGDATLTVMSGSHVHHLALAEHFGLTEKGKDWHKLTPPQIRWLEDQGCKQQHIECPAGSLVLWDSRTVHCGRSPSEGRVHRRNRYVVYVCMTPASLLDKGDAAAKRQACLDGRMTSHWPHKPKLFPLKPRRLPRGGTLPDIPPLPQPVLSALGARLAGWRPGMECALQHANK